MSKPPLKPRISDKPFVGYEKTPSVDRRFLLAFGGVTTLLTAGMGYAIARVQPPGGRGSWDMGTEVSLTGAVAAAPYAHMRVLEAGRVHTVLLGCETKCGARERLEQIGFQGGGATVRGSMLERDGYRMLATKSGDDWIETSLRLDRIPAPVITDLGEARLSGEILDTKCWFGAMRPNEGLSHKACATLCIASGVPPYFGVRDGQGRERALMITDPDGRALVQPILEFVAEPIEAVGRIVQIDDLFQFRMDVGTVRRLA
jgi:hypothetical protein